MSTSPIFVCAVRGFARRGAALVLVAALAACGGGDGGSAQPTVVQPPTQAATIAASTGEAGSAVMAAVGGAQSIVRQAAGLDSSFLLFGNPLAAGTSPNSLASRIVAASREKAAATQTIGCSTLFGTTACSGSMTIDTNAADNATVLAAGTYVSIRFNALSGSDGFTTLSLNGTIRIDFLTTFDPSSVTFANARIQLAVTNFSGSYDGVSFGPESSVALIEFDAAGLGTFTVDGMRIDGLDGLTATDENNYSLLGTTLRSAHWIDTSRFTDTHFSNWTVVNGRPTFGSRLMVSAGTSSVSISVTSATATSVVYRAVFDINGVVSTYIVTATYPAGGGAPTYTAVPG